MYNWHFTFAETSGHQTIEEEEVEQVEEWEEEREEEEEEEEEEEDESEEDEEEDEEEKKEEEHRGETCPQEMCVLCLTEPEKETEKVLCMAKQATKYVACVPKKN